MEFCFSAVTLLEGLSVIAIACTSHTWSISILHGQVRSNGKSILLYSLIIQVSMS